MEAAVIVAAGTIPSRDRTRLRATGVPILMRLHHTAKPVPVTRREALHSAALAWLAASFAVPASAASEFWNKKKASEWSNEEITRLTTHSPWAREVNAEFELDSDYTTNGAEGPTTGPGGVINAPGKGSGAPAQIELGRDRNNSPRGVRRREPVTVRWESAQPVLDAVAVPLPQGFEGRYVISVSGLPIGVMERPRRGESAPMSADPRENTPAARQRRMVEQLQTSATLEARGREPEQPGVVRPVPRTSGTYLFGFSKELLPLTANDREIVFTLRTALMSVRAKFDPKEMVYHGQLAV
jgi:hypothetical protein